MTKKQTNKPITIQEAGRRGGLANTRKQRRARKQNARLGGRPRRVCTHCGEPVRGGHLDGRRDLSCGVHGWKWEKPSDRRR
jgi:hypothetical protein